MDVGFTLMSGHDQRRHLCLLSAMCGRLPAGKSKLHILEVRGGPRLQSTLGGHWMKLVQFALMTVTAMSVFSQFINVDARRRTNGLICTAILQRCRHCQSKFVYFAKTSEPDFAVIDFPAFFRVDLSGLIAAPSI
jgi:hypothetical protein